MYSLENLITTIHGRKRAGEGASLKAGLDFFYARDLAKLPQPLHLFNLHRLPKHFQEPFDVIKKLEQKGIVIREGSKEIVAKLDERNHVLDVNFSDILHRDYLAEPKIGAVYFYLVPDPQIPGAQLYRLSKAIFDFCWTHEGFRPSEQFARLISLKAIKFSQESTEAQSFLSRLKLLDMLNSKADELASYVEEIIEKVLDDLVYKPAQAAKQAGIAFGLGSFLG